MNREEVDALVAAQHPEALRSPLAQLVRDMTGDHRNAAALHAAESINACQERGIAYDQETLSHNLESNFPDLARDDCDAIAAAAIEQAPVGMPDPFNNPVYMGLTKIYDLLWNLKFEQEQINRAVAELNTKKVEAKHTLLAELDELAKHIAIPTEVDFCTEVLTIEEEWFEFKDTLEAVKLVDKPVFKDRYEIAKEYLASKRGAA